MWYQTGCSGDPPYDDPDENPPPCLVLLDLKLPRRSGLEVLSWLRSRINTRPLPVVMMTSSRQEQDLVESYRLGANGYVVKPVKFQEFVDAVKQVGLFWAVLNEMPSSKPAAA